MQIDGQSDQKFNLTYKKDNVKFLEKNSLKNSHQLTSW